MKRDQAESSAKLVSSILPAQASVKVFSHGDKTPAGYFLSVVRGSEQHVISTVDGVADYLKRTVAGERASGKSTTATPTSNAANGSNGNGGQRA